MKIIPPKDPGAFHGPRVPASQVAREKAIEKERARYIKLACGHLTNWDTQELYSVWRPARGKFYCEASVNYGCGKWANRAPKSKAEVLSDEPLF